MLQPPVFAYIMRLILEVRGANGIPNGHDTILTACTCTFQSWGHAGYQ